MIVLSTDFGLAGPYTGQVKVALHAEAPEVAVIDLFADLPAGDVKAAAYLLAAYDDRFPPGTVFLCVVDPGVGSARRAIAVQADGCWYVGPDNGLFEMVVRRARSAVEVFEISWRPERISASFHGRDLFAPVAARLARGETPAAAGLTALPEGAARMPAWPDALHEIVYVDAYGNAMTGISADAMAPGAGLLIGDRSVRRAVTFSSVSPGQVFCYENSNGLMEVAVNRGSACVELGLRVGSAVRPE